MNLIHTLLCIQCRENISLKFFSNFPRMNFLKTCFSWYISISSMQRVKQFWLKINTMIRELKMKLSLTLPKYTMKLNEKTDNNIYMRGLVFIEALRQKEKWGPPDQIIHTHPYKSPYYICGKLENEHLQYFLITFWGFLRNVSWIIYSWSFISYQWRFASELRENHEEMFPQYYIRSDI